VRGRCALLSDGRASGADRDLWLRLGARDRLTAAQAQTVLDTMRTPEVALEQPRTPLRALAVLWTRIVSEDAGAKLALAERNAVISPTAIAMVIGRAGG